MKEITDNEIRFLGMDDYSSPPHDLPVILDSKTKPKRHRWKWVIGIVFTLFAIIIIMLIFIIHNFNESYFYAQKSDISTELLKSEKDYLIDNSKSEENISCISNKNGSAQVNVKEDSINDIHFTIISPEGCTPHLYIGKLDTTDTNIMVCARAADIRGDNHGIVSAFVLKGEPISRGIAMKGFCAILSDTITLGMDEETPLYERVVEHGGDFFRQYSYIHEGKMMENNPKGKSIRKALCLLKGHICLIVSSNNESMHDFAQALQDYGVEEAIALEGGDSTFFIRKKNDYTKWYGKFYPEEDKLNYIIFSKN